MIRTGEENLTAGIRECISLCFPDQDQKYFDFFFRHVYRPEHGYADVEDGKVVSVILRIPHNVMFNGRVLKTSMLVGVCTHPDYRGQGRMAEVMHTVLDACSHSELITFIQSDKPELYTRYGFRTVYYRTDYTLSADNIRKVNPYGCMYDPSPVDMLKVYSVFIRRFNGFYTRDLGYFQDLKKEIAAEGGRIIASYDAKNQIRGYETILPYGDRAKIEECIYLDSTALLKLLNVALGEKPVVHLHTSQAENMKVLFPGAPERTYGHTMARLNDAALFSRLYGVAAADVEEAFSLTNRPLNMNETR